MMTSALASLSLYLRCLILDYSLDCLRYSPKRAYPTGQGWPSFHCLTSLIYLATLGCLRMETRRRRPSYRLDSSKIQMNRTNWHYQQHQHQHHLLLVAISKV